MEENSSKPYRFAISLTPALIKRLQAEVDFKKDPVASHATIKKIIEVVQKKYKSVELNYKGK